MSTKLLELLAGTRNAGKILEIQELLADLPIRLLSLNDFADVRTVAETGDTYEQNSNLKALGYASQTRMLTLADDSGLEVDALGGKPGVLSARFGGDSASDNQRIDKLLRAINETPGPARTARFVSCMTIAGWEFRKEATSHPVILSTSRGELQGEITPAPRGSNGFGYDPVFIPRRYLKTLAELPSEIKNNISHRAQALAGIRAFLERSIGKLDRSHDGP